MINDASLKHNAANNWYV